MPANLLREIIPLTQNDCFTIFSRQKDHFDFPLHTHEEFELNLIVNAKNSKRIIGDHISEIDNLELVLVEPNLQHGWFTHKCTSKNIHDVTIQFQYISTKRDKKYRQVSCGLFHCAGKRYRHDQRKSNEGQSKTENYH